MNYVLPWNNKIACPISVVNLASKYDQYYDSPKYSDIVEYSGRLKLKKIKAKQCMLFKAFTVAVTELIMCVWCVCVLVC